MEAWFAPVLFAAAGFAFGAWVLSSDARRMGFARPRATERGARPSSRAMRRWLVPAILSLSIPLVVTVRAARTASGVLLLAAGLGKIATGAGARRRRAEMRREWPFLIESMAVAALSGMETGAAFQSAARRTKGALREEVDKVLLRMTGGAPLSRALGAVDETALPNVKRLRTVLAQSEILGTPVAEMLKAVSDEGYEAERQEMEERFNALPLQLSAITVFFLLPPVLAVSIVPHVLAFLEARW